MANLPISREQALELLKKYNKDVSDFNHFLESEAIMRVLAKKLGEDIEYWGMLGLLHDVDWGLAKHDSRIHLTKAPEILREAGFDEKFVNDLISHGYGFDCAGLIDNMRTEKIQHALAAAETITGLIHAYAIMRGRKVSDMEAKGLSKKFKDKAFAAGVRRDIIQECEKLGMDINEFFQLSIDAVKGIASDVGLN